MPSLSVVVPIYNIERFLRPALESLVTQTFQDLDVVMVDDGSTDNSGSIAAEYAEKDSRFRLVTQPNGGLSRARNTGIKHATGDYLAFVDSDDVSPYYALKTAVRTLETTGSDFLTAKVLRFDERGAFPVPMQRKSHAKSKLQTNIAESPGLMRDFLPHNKVYRRTFWDLAGLQFPDGLMFEDGPVSVRAHAEAKTVDVVSVPIYYWRLRDGAIPSISRQHAGEHFYTDRIETSIISADYLAAERPELLEEFYEADIRHKFGIMFNNLPRTTSEVQELFIEVAVRYLQRVPRRVIDECPDTLRDRLLLARDGDLAALLESVASAGGQPANKGNPARASDPGKGQAPGATVARVRNKLRRLTLTRTAAHFLGRTPVSDQANGVVHGIEADGDKLRLTGFGGLQGLPAEGRLAAANRLIWARHEDSGTKVRASLRSSPDPLSAAADASSSSGPSGGGRRGGLLPKRAPSGRRDGYDVVLDLNKLRDGSGRWRYGVWLLELGAVTARGVRGSGLRAGRTALPRDLRPVDVDANARVIPVIEAGVLTLRVERPEASLAECRVEGDDLVLRGVARGALPAGTRLRLCRVPEIAELELPVETEIGEDGATSFTSRLRIEDLIREIGPARAVPVSGTQNRLLLELGEPRQSGRVVQARRDFPLATVSGLGHQLDCGVGPDGMAAVTLRAEFPRVTSVEWRSDGTLLFAGSGGGRVARPQLVLRSSKGKEERALPIEIGPHGEWRFELDPEHAPLGAVKVALRSGKWQLVLRAQDDSGEIIDVDLPFVPSALPPSGVLWYEQRYDLRMSGPDSLGLRIHSRIADDDRGKINQRRLREEVYPEMRSKLALRDAVLYDSFNGTQYSDSPRALHELLSERDLGLEHLWVTCDAQAPVPDGVATVETNTREWYEALATSRYVVSSRHLPSWFRRREGQTVTQTWDGVGLKRIAHDIESVHPLDKAYLDKLDAEVANWSLMLSPNSFCTPILRRAFQYEGQVSEIGNPRNDLLISGDRESISASLRRDLGIPDDKKILLYAPTWRDHEHSGGNHTFELRLDAWKFPEKLRQEYVLLVRRHPETVNDLIGDSDDEFVFDVGRHPDIRQLLIAADVLISDYSAVALDFLNTGRPILFYAYDLEHYRDNVRGLYLDLEAEGPGPVLRTTEEVIGALSDLDAVTAEHRERYEALRKTFCHLEDGKATERFAAQLLGERFTR